jgi:hypothetical protein
MGSIQQDYAKRYKSTANTEKIQLNFFYDSGDGGDLLSKSITTVNKIYRENHCLTKYPHGLDNQHIKYQNHDNQFNQQWHHVSDARPTIIDGIPVMAPMQRQPQYTICGGEQRKRDNPLCAPVKTNPNGFSDRSQNNKHEASTNDRRDVRLGKKMMRRILEDPRRTTIA